MRSDKTETLQQPGSNQSRTSTVSRESFAQAIRAIKQLPSPPEVCQAIVRGANDERTTLDEFCLIVRADIALAARLIQVVNSAYFGLPNRISSVSRAISMLGFSTVKSLALGFFYNEKLGRLRLPGLPYPDLPSFSMAVSSLCEAIAQTVAPEIRADASSLGLLHESGTIVMTMAFGNQYRQAMAGAGEDYWLAERAAFGLDHAQAGAMLMEGWRMDEGIVSAIAAHHDPRPPAPASSSDELLWRILSLASSASLLFFQDADLTSVSSTVHRAKNNFDWTPALVADALIRAVPIYHARAGLLAADSSQVERHCFAASRAAELLPSLAH